MTVEGAKIMAHTLLSCFCTGSPLADSLREDAVAGGHNHGRSLRQGQLRTWAGRADIHPFAHLFPTRAPFPIAGHA